MGELDDNEFILKEEPETSNQSSTSIHMGDTKKKSTSPEFTLYKIRWPI